MIGDKGAVVVHLVVIPHAEANLSGGKVFDLACKLFAVLSANSNIHFLHGFAQAVPHVHGRGVVALDVIVYVGDNKTRLWSGWNETGLILVWFVRVCQFPCPDNKAGASAIGLPALLVLRAVARRQEALQKNGVRI